MCELTFKVGTTLKGIESPNFWLRPWHFSPWTLPSSLLPVTMAPTGGPTPSIFKLWLDFGLLGHYKRRSPVDNVPNLWLVSLSYHWSTRDTPKCSTVCCSKNHLEQKECPSAWNHPNYSVTHLSYGKISCHLTRWACYGENCFRKVGGAMTYLQLVNMVKIQFTNLTDLLPQIQEFCYGSTWWELRSMNSDPRW